MNKTLCALLSLALLGGAWGCSDDESNGKKPVAPDALEYPMLGERPLPTLGPPDDMGSKPPLSSDQGEGFDLSSPQEDMDSFCCPVTFAIADNNGTADELQVRLVGASSPLNEGLTLSYADGVWSVATCVVPQYSGSYSYVFAYEVDGEIEEVVALNPHAPRDSTQDNSSNTWLTSDSCEDSSPALHAVTSK